VTKIIAFATYNSLIHQEIQWIVIYVVISISIYRSIVYMIVPSISIILYVPHIVVSCIDFAVNFFVSKVSASIIMTKKYILILDRE
jgi:hypothetical protein